MARQMFKDYNCFSAKSEFIQVYISLLLNHLQTLPLGFTSSKHTLLVVHLSLKMHTEPCQDVPPNYTLPKVTPAHSWGQSHFL